RRYAEEREGPARPEVDARDRGVLRRVDHEVPAVGPGDNRPGQPPAATGVRRVVDPDLVIAEVDHQLDRPARQNPLPRVRGGGGARPESRDELAERRGGSVGVVEHRFPARIAVPATWPTRSAGLRAELGTGGRSTCSIGNTCGEDRAGAVLTRTAIHPAEAPDTTGPIPLLTHSVPRRRRERR